MRFTTKLLPSRSGNLGVLLLNNPRPLHALTLDMMHCQQDVLQAWLEDDTVKAILVKANQAEVKKPAFCAGGDVKTVYMAGVSKGALHGQGEAGLETADFFREEYKVNHAIATATKPYISFWDGIVMGGGVGLSIHGKYRVATEQTLFAMPETAIGLFPDVGSLWWMPRKLPGGMAVYLALTGHRLKAEDLIYTGLATHYVPAARLQELEAALVKATQKNDEDDRAGIDDIDVVAPVLKSFHESPPTDPLDSFLAQHRSSIEEAFDPSDATRRLEDMMETLRSMDNDFSRTTLTALQKLSPTSLKVTLEGLRRGAQMGSIGEDLQMEFRLSQAFMRPGSDFYEGIRAVLVDKDHCPKWKPDKIEDVTDGVVESHFAPIAHEWELPSSKL